MKTDPTPLAEVERLGKASRRAAVLSSLGATVVLASLVFAALRLQSLQEDLALLGAQRDSLAVEIADLGDSVSVLQDHLSGSRCALAASRTAIGAFHQRRYESAVLLYDEALNCDPGNAYLLNLRAYAQFKLGNVDAAIRGQRRSLDADPTYAWGYFDLARFLCAAGSSHMAEAREAIERALALRPSLRPVMQSDGEFTSLCRRVYPGE